MIIDPISLAGADAPLRAAAAPAAQAAPQTGFMQLVGEPLDAVNEALRQADAATLKFATGETTSVHDVMLTIEHAKMQLHLAVEVRNRAVEAYQELMRMQL